MSDVGEVRSSNMELIDQLQKAKAAIEKLSAIRDRQKTQIDVSWPKYISHWHEQLTNQQLNEFNHDGWSKINLVVFNKGAREQLFHLTPQGQLSVQQTIGIWADQKVLLTKSDDGEAGM